MMRCFCPRLGRRALSCHDPVASPHRAGRSHRQCHGVVRFRRLWLFRQRHRRPVFSRVEPGCAAAPDIHGVRARIRRASHRQPGAGRDRRSHRAARPAGVVDRAHGWSDAADRTAAELRVHRRRGSHPAGRAAPAAGILGGRRIHGLDGVHHRASAVGNPRPRQQLRGGGCHAGLHSRIGLRLVDPHAARTRAGRGLRLAPALHRQRAVPGRGPVAAARAARDRRRDCRPRHCGHRSFPRWSRTGARCCRLSASSR